jgi:hypothetical protein
MTAVTPGTRELAARESDDLHVMLLWHPREDELTISVEDSGRGDRFQLAVAPIAPSMPSITSSPTPPKASESRRGKGK